MASREFTPMDCDINRSSLFTGKAAQAEVGNFLTCTNLHVLSSSFRLDSLITMKMTDRELFIYALSRMGINFDVFSEPVEVDGEEISINHVNLDTDVPGVEGMTVIHDFMFCAEGHFVDSAIAIEAPHALFGEDDMADDLESFFESWRTGAGEDGNDFI